MTSPRFLCQQFHYGFPQQIYLSSGNFVEQASETNAGLFGADVRKILFDVAIGKLKFKDEAVGVGNIRGKKTVTALNTCEVEIGSDSLVIAVSGVNIFGESGNREIFQRLRRCLPVDWQDGQTISDQPAQLA